MELKREEAVLALSAQASVKMAPSTPTVCPGLALIPASATNSLESNLTSQSFGWQ